MKMPNESLKADHSPSGFFGFVFSQVGWAKRRHDISIWHNIHRRFAHHCALPGSLIPQKKEAPLSRHLTAMP